MKWFCRSV